MIFRNFFKIWGSIKDLNIFFGIDKELNRSFSLLIEYDAALNDNDDKYELEDFADKFLDDFQDKLSYSYFKVVLDVNDSEIVIDKKFGILTSKSSFGFVIFENGALNVILKKMEKVKKCNHIKNVG